MGGVLFEGRDDLGLDPVQRVVIIDWLHVNAGMRANNDPEGLDPEVAHEPVGTATVGAASPGHGHASPPWALAMTGRSSTTCRRCVER